jgi:hypothetical protein
MEAKRRILGLLAAAGLLAGFAAGCVYKPVQIGGPMFGNEELKGRRLVTWGEGKACSSHILYAIPVGDDSTETALERLNGKSGWSADLITVESGQAFWLLGWSNCTRITAYGTAAPATKFKTTFLPGSASPPPSESTSPAATPAPVEKPFGGSTEDQ